MSLAAVISSTLGSAASSSGVSSGSGEHRRRLGFARRSSGRRLRGIGLRTTLGAPGVLLQPRPAGEELAAHSSSPRSRSRRRCASASGSARSRLRLMNGRSTWKASKKAATLAWISSRHRDRLDDLADRPGERFALVRIRRHRRDLVVVAADRPQRHPERRPAGREIVAVMRGLGRMQPHLEGAGVEQLVLTVPPKGGPRRGRRSRREHRVRAAKRGRPTAP